MEQINGCNDGTGGGDRGILQHLVVFSACGNIASSISKIFDSCDAEARVDIIELPNSPKVGLEPGCDCVQKGAKADVDVANKDVPASEMEVTVPGRCEINRTRKR